MEDLCFKYLYPEEYNDLIEKIELKKDERLNYVNDIVSELTARMQEAGIEGKVFGRNKDEK